MLLPAVTGWAQDITELQEQAMQSLEQGNYKKALTQFVEVDSLLVVKNGR